MNHDLLPWNLLSASVLVGTETEGWNLAEPHGEDSPERSFAVEVFFASPFTTIPVVHLGLTGFDLEQHSSARVLLTAEQVTEQGFVARITTWRSSRVYAVSFNWMAVGA